MKSFSFNQLYRTGVVKNKEKKGALFSVAYILDADFAS